MLNFVLVCALTVSGGRIRGDGGTGRARYGRRDLMADAIRDWS